MLPRAENCGKRAAWITSAGFFAMIWTFYEVNYVLGGLHSYAAVSDPSFDLSLPMKNDRYPIVRGG